MLSGDDQGIAKQLALGRMQERVRGKDPGQRARNRHSPERDCRRHGLVSIRTKLREQAAQLLCGDPLGGVRSQPNTFTRCVEVPAAPDRVVDLGSFGRPPQVQAPSPDHLGRGGGAADGQGDAPARVRPEPQRCPHLASPYTRRAVADQICSSSPATSRSSWTQSGYPITAVDTGQLLPYISLSGPRHSSRCRTNGTTASAVRGGSSGPCTVTESLAAVLGALASSSIARSQ